MSRRLLAFCLLVASCGGGSGGNPAPDAGPPQDVGIERPDGIVRPDAGTPAFVPTEPAPPEIPWLDSAGPLGPASLPVLTPCPAGWREIPPRDVLSPAVCDPWPESGMREDCAPDEAHFPGEADCTRIGPECPAGDWPEDLPADSRILYVRAGELAGGDGTRERPFGRIDTALAAALDGDVIALSKGTFDSGVVGRANVSIHGACVSETIVAPGSGTAVGVGAATVELRSVTVRGASRGVSIGVGGVGRLDDVVVLATRGHGIEVIGGELGGRNVVVRDVLGDFASAIVANTSASIDLERVAVLRTRVDAVRALAGSVVSLQDVVIHRAGSLGVRADEATVVLRRAVLAHSDDFQIVAEGNGTDASVTLVESLVADDAEGGNIKAEGRGALDVSRSRVVYAAGVGLTAAGARASLEASDLVLERSAVPSVDHGPAIVAAGGGRARVERVHISDAAVAGINVPAGFVEASDVVVLRTSGGDGIDGQGVFSEAGGTLTLRRAALIDNHGGGVRVANTRSSADLEDVIVRGTGVDAIGVLVIAEASATLSRVNIERCTHRGIYALAEVSLHDVRVDACLSEPGSGLLGNGIVVEAGGHVVGERVEVRLTHEIGVTAVGREASITLRDARIESTQLRACGAACAGYELGYGVGAYDGAAIELTRFAIVDNAFGGLQLANDGTIDLHDGRVSGHEVGANVQTLGFDVNRLFDGVLFVDNGIDVDGSLLAVPDPPEE